MRSIRRAMIRFEYNHPAYSVFLTVLRRIFFPLLCLQWDLIKLFFHKFAYNSSLSYLHPLGVFERVPRRSTDDPMIFLTLDVEWTKTDCTLRMLDTLKEKQVCATLFLQGSALANNRALAERMVRDGHVCANHTMTHPDLTACSPAQVRQELDSCRQVFRETTGTDMIMAMRPPYGRLSPKLALQLHRMGYRCIHWSIHTADYAEPMPTWEDYVSTLGWSLSNGGILLQHDFSPATAENLGNIIDHCRSKGFRFATREEIIRCFTPKK